MSLDILESIRRAEQYEKVQKELLRRAGEGLDLAMAEPDDLKALRYAVIALAQMTLARP